MTNPGKCDVFFIENSSLSVHQMQLSKTVKRIQNVIVYLNLPQITDLSSWMIRLEQFSLLNFLQ